MNYHDYFRKPERQLLLSLPWALLEKLDNQVVTRSNYFLTANAFLLIAYVQALNGHERVALMISITSFCGALAWLQVGRLTAHFHRGYHRLTMFRYPIIRHTERIIGRKPRFRRIFSSAPLQATGIPLILLVLWSALVTRSLLRAQVITKESSTTLYNFVRICVDDYFFYLFFIILLACLVFWSLRTRCLHRKLYFTVKAGVDRVATIKCMVK